uniref:PDZ domain-containing protein n=1 Tax=Oryza meridionalis TaxID=40149 RepID=A0A0E0EHV0_9ORYZ
MPPKKPRSAPRRKICSSTDAATGESPVASGTWTRSRTRRMIMRLDSTVSDCAGGDGVQGGGGGGGVGGGQGGGRGGGWGGGRGTAEPEVPACSTPRKSKRIVVVSPSSGSVLKKSRKTTPQKASRTKERGTTAAAGTSLASRPVPLRYPDYPSLQPGQHTLSNKYMCAVGNWMTECSRISKLEKQAHRKDIPTLRGEPKDPRTADAVVSSEDKAMVGRVACSVVGVKSKKPDGELVSQCTGIVVGLDGVNKCAKILTAASLVCDFEGELHDPTLMLSVHLPNKVVTEGRLLHFNVHYGVALLEILGDFQLQVLSFGSSINYGMDVFVLARDESMSLMVRHGKISWLYYPMLWNNHCMFLSCDIPQGASGGPVIDHDGNFVAIALVNNPSPVVIPVSTIRTCIDMWLQFSRVARPILGMQLEAVELLDVSRQEELRCDYNVTGGFVVNQVNVDSTAETLGIRRGDVIVFQDTDSCTSPQLENYLLSLGWGYLQGIRLTADLKVEVHNLMDSYRESITFPLQFSDASRRVD